MALGKLRTIQLETNLDALPSDIANLGTHELSPYREARDAAFRTHGMATRLGTHVVYALVEEDDYDFVTVLVRDETAHYCAVQLKELVLDELNPAATLGELMDSAARRYASTERTTLAIHVNKIGTLTLESIDVPDVPFAEVYLFGAVENDQSRWVLIGDLKGESGVSLPTAEQPMVVVPRRSTSA